MGFRRCSAWTYFQKNEGERAKCTLCDAVISIKRGNVYNMSRHLKAKHPDIFYAGSSALDSIVSKPDASCSKRSAAWHYFKKTGSNVHCSLCKKELKYSGNTSNLNDHLRRRHPGYLTRIVAAAPTAMDVTPPVTEQKQTSGTSAFRFKRISPWKNFLKLEGHKAQCKHCPAVLSFKNGSVCNLSRHYQARHTGLMAEAPPPPAPPPPPPPAAASDPSSSTSAIDSSGDQEFHTDNEMEEESIADTPQEAEVPPEKIVHQASEDKCFPEPMSPDEHSLITQQLVRMIVNDCQPLNIVDQVEFREFLNMLNPRYVIPSQKELSTVHIPRLYQSLETDISAKLSQAAAVSITVDKWTLGIVQNYLSVTAHFIAEDSTLASALLECVKLPQAYTDDEIHRNLERIFSVWEIANKIAAVVSENVPNIVSAVQKGKWRHLPCTAHSLNSIVQSALQEIAELRGKCKGIVEYFKKSPLHSDTLAETQKKLNVEQVELKQDVITRWHSTYDMLKHLLASKVPIEVSLMKLNAENALNLTDWLVMERTCDILQMFDLVTAEMTNGKDINISKQIILINAIRTKLHKSNLKDEPREIVALISKLVGGISNHFSYLDNNRLILESSLLDPRFKQIGFSNENTFENAYQHVIETASETELPQEPGVPEAKTSTSLIWREFDEMIRLSKIETNSTHGVLVELDKYIQEKMVRRDTNPLTWWSDRKVFYPRLYRLMKARLCIVPSVPSERVFSKGCVSLCQRRNKVPSLKVSEIVFLKFNLM